MKNYANYYISNSQFDILISFFQLFDGNSTFTEGEFENAFNKFKIRNEKETNETPSITKDYISFLQFWYDVNVIGYKERIAEERNNFYHWSYRERNALNVMPKIKKDVFTSYILVYLKLLILANLLSENDFLQLTTCEQIYFLIS